MSAPGSIHAARCTCSICRPIDSPQDILRAQFSLDHQPDSSPYWDSQDGQDDLGVIVDNNLRATTTAQYAQDWFDAQMRAGRAALDDES